MTQLYSFDLFDTLVCRTVRNPSAVFKLMETYTDISYKNIIYKKIGFKKLRILSERIARKLSSREEVTLDEIYIILSIFVRNAEKIKHYEIECEFSVLHPICKQVDLLTKLLSEGKECCIISDMYLPLEVVQRIIESKINIDTSKVPIFLSSEVMKTKHSGRLYKVVKDYYGVNYDDILHYGDNEIADILVAKNLGIQVVRIKEYNEKVDTDNIFALLKPIDKKKLDNVFYELGFYLAGPCAWCTVKWIERDLQSKDIKKVFFGARDGFIFEKFFREMTQLDSTYFKISRRALFLPFIHSNTKDIEVLFEDCEEVSATEFFERLNMVCPTDIKNIWPYENREIFISALYEQGFFDKCYEESLSLQSYLDCIDFIGKVAFFDLGWKGSLQKSLKSILKEKVDITGYYFGLSSKKHDNKKFKSFFFSKNREFTRMAIVYQCIAFLEFIFTEPESSLKNYSLSDGKIIFNYIDNKEPSIYSEYRQKVIEGALDFLTIVQPIFKTLSISDSDLEKCMEEMVFYYGNTPPERVVKVFSQIEHSSAFGGVYTRKIIEHKPFTLNNYRKSFWRAGYIRTLSGTDRVLAFTLHNILYKFGGLYIKKLLD